MLDETSREVTTEEGFGLTIECLKAVEILMTSPNLAPVNSADNRADQLLVFLIPVLISHLMESASNLEQATKLKLQLHDHSRVKLEEILRRWPEVCKAVLEEHPFLKSKLEAAAKAQAERVQAAIAGARDNLLQQQQNRMQDKPSIKLTMDFSNFAAKS